MKEFANEHGRDIDLKALQGGWMELEDYKRAHAGLPIVTHDVFLWYQDGFVLVKRNNKPGEGEYYPVGGRVIKCVPLLESLGKRVKQECNLEILNPEQLEVVRSSYASDFFGHGKGSDNFLILFAAEASGELILDEDHDEVLIVKPENFSELKKQLHPVVTHGLELAFAWRERKG